MTIFDAAQRRVGEGGGEHPADTELHNEVTGWQQRAGRESPCPAEAACARLI